MNEYDLELVGIKRFPFAFSADFKTQIVPSHAGLIYSSSFFGSYTKKG